MLCSQRVQMDGNSCLHELFISAPDCGCVVKVWYWLWEQPDPALLLAYALQAVCLRLTLSSVAQPQATLLLFGYYFGTLMLLRHVS